jgi:hypothetical protein
MFLGIRVRPARKADNRTWAVCLDNVGSLTSRNPVDIYGPIQGQIYFLHFTFKEFSCEETPFFSGVETFSLGDSSR